MIKRLRSTDYDLQTNQGFTLIELMVAMSAFAVVILIFVGTFTNSLGFYRHSVAIQQTVENSSYVLESLAKEIRVSEVSASQSSECPTANLAVTHPVNGAIVYSLQNGAIIRRVNGEDNAVSSINVTFTRFEFCVTGAAAGDSRQPRITILGSVRDSNLSGQAPIDVQTTVSQRVVGD